jgi:Fe2+ transport system protein FeoA
MSTGHQPSGGPGTTRNEARPLADQPSSGPGTTRNAARPLADLPVGASAIVVRLDAAGPIRRRLLEMGFVRGVVLRVEKLAPLGDPMELVIKGYHLSLRREESQCILVSQED